MVLNQGNGALAYISTNAPLRAGTKLLDGRVVPDTICRPI
jgi:hypothetical protein